MVTIQYLFINVDLFSDLIGRIQTNIVNRNCKRENIMNQNFDLHCIVNIKIFLVYYTE